MAERLPPVTARLRLLDPWGGQDIERELALAELETSERGVAVDAAFYPWRRVVSYEWEIVEHASEVSPARPRQLMVRVLTQSTDGGVEEHRVAADRFEVGPWTVSMLVPERVEPEEQRAVFRRVTVPWHRVLEYERMLAELPTASTVPDRPDVRHGAAIGSGGTDDVATKDASHATEAGSVDSSDEPVWPPGDREERWPPRRATEETVDRGDPNVIDISSVDPPEPGEAEDEEARDHLKDDDVVIAADDADPETTSAS
jgi:hypothetical protein